MTFRQYIKESIRKAKTAFGIGLSLVSFSALARAQDPAEIAKQEFFCPRVKIESTINDGEHQTNTFVGLSKPEKNGRGNEYAEFARAIHRQDSATDTEKLALGINKGFNIGDLANKMWLYGTTADNEGVGFESWHKLGDTKLELTAEHNATSDASHFGTGINQTIGKLTLGAGFDRVHNEEDTDSSLAWLRYVHNKQTEAGMSFQTSHLPTGDKNHRVDSYISMITPRNWYLRPRVITKWGDTQNKRLELGLQAWQNPTCGTYSAFLVNRDAYDGAVHAKSVVESATAFKGNPPQNKLSRGLVMDLTGAVEDTPAGTAGSASIQLGYKVPVWGFAFTPSVIYSRDIHPNSDDSEQCGAELFVHHKKGARLQLRATTDSKDTTAFVGLQQQF